MKVTWETNVAVMSDLNFTLKNLRSFYESGATLSCGFKKNTRSFQRSHDKNDKEINAAIYADLK